MIYDLIIVGSGFGGALLAMIARRLGKSVLLLEKGRHPRVVIGESTTPVSNLLLEELTARYDLPRLRPLCKWGTWQREYPQVACGLKRGFTFYHHDLDSPKPRDPERGDQLLVEASPTDEAADTHWYRADVDLFFVEEAQRMGVEYRDNVNLSDVQLSDDGVAVQGWKGRFLVDATGPRGFLHRALGLGELPLPGMPGTSALYSHFSGVGKLDSEGAPPYPVNDAAVHHVFDGGWIWMLQFNNGITSAGVAGTRFVSGGQAVWEGLVARIPMLQRQFVGARAVQPFREISRLPFRSAAIVGPRWALLPSAAGFVDPLLSTGFPMTLFGVARLAEMLERGVNAGGLTAYAVETENDLLATARLVAALYANMSDFARFAALSMLYFAPAIFSETARRSGRAAEGGAFLMRDREPFAAAARGILEEARAGADTASLEARIAAVIEPINIAGLANPARRNWYTAL